MTVMRYNYFILKLVSDPYIGMNTLKNTNNNTSRLYSYTIIQYYYFLKKQVNELKSNIR